MDRAAERGSAGGSRGAGREPSHGSSEERQSVPSMANGVQVRSGSRSTTNLSVNRLVVFLDAHPNKLRVMSAVLAFVVSHLTKTCHLMLFGCLENAI